MHRGRNNKMSACNKYWANKFESWFWLLSVLLAEQMVDQLAVLVV